MNMNNVAAILYDSTRAESMASANAGNTTTIYAIAMADSANGKVKVFISDDVTNASGRIQNASVIEVPTSPKVKAGDTVAVTLVGATSAKHPYVSSVVGSGDSQQSDIDSAAASASNALESAYAAAQSAASAQTSADAASEAAAQAISDANTANTKATEATESAEIAATQADAAIQSANTAAEAAANAENSAAEAATAASDAKSLAEEAQKSASAAADNYLTTAYAMGRINAAVEEIQDLDLPDHLTYFYHDSLGAHILDPNMKTQADVGPDGLHIIDIGEESTDLFDLANFTKDSAQIGKINAMHTSITSTGMAVNNGDEDVAVFGETTVLGKDGEVRTVIKAGGVYFTSKSPDSSTIVDDSVAYITTTGFNANSLTAKKYLNLGDNWQWQVRSNGHLTLKRLS